MEGFLQIWHGFFSRWVKYYFRIHQDTLMFGPKRQVIESKIHLKVAQIISIVDDPISFIIHTGTDTLRIRANSIDQRVKWFKKLKKIQKNIEEQNYVKQMSSLNYQKSKSNRIKMLQSIALDLWQYHAQLQSQANDISDRCKTIPGVKNLTEKLRMNVQSIKLKTSQALKIIQQYTRSERQKRGTGGTPRGAYRISNSQPYQNNYNQNSGYHQPDGTMFMSFQDNKNGDLFKKFKKESYKEQFKQFKDSSIKLNNRPSININQAQNSTVTPFKLQSSMKMISPNRNYQIQNPLKQRLLQSNPVFIDVKRTLGTNKARTHLPQKFTPQQKFPLGSVVKGAIGADLSKFALPVALNQPLSLLQKGCQQMYYSKILEQANEQTMPQKRMLYVVAFLISQYSLSDLRIKKPFNPLLGQTFQFYDTERQLIYTSQQVCHHPPISAIYCRSDSYQIFDRSQGKTTFTGTSIKITLQGKSKIKLQKHQKEQYLYDKCPVHMNNLLMGKTQLEAVGQMNVQCKATKSIGKITFKQQSFFSKSSIHEIEGQIKINNEKIYTISGKWNQYVKATDLRDKNTISVWNKTHICNKDYYYFNDYTMLLNHLHKQNLAEMAPTDSRLRPDQRALQYRNVDLADSEKLRLQQKQRAKRKENQQRKIVHQMKWFDVQTDKQGNQFYILNNRNKTDSQNGQWPNYPDIF